MDYIAAFPELIERQRIDVRRARLFENQPKRLRSYWRRVDECAVNVERQQLVHARSLCRTVSSLPFSANLLERFPQKTARDAPDDLLSAACQGDEGARALDRAGERLAADAWFLERKDRLLTAVPIAPPPQAAR